VNEELLIGGAVLLAWLLARASAGSGSSSQGPVGPETPAAEFARVVGDVSATEPDFFLSYGAPIVGAPGPTEPRTGSDSYRATLGARVRQRRALWFHQVWSPASRVAISSLTPADFAMADLFLADQLTRPADILTAGQQVLVSTLAQASASVKQQKDILSGASSATFGLTGLAGLALNDDAVKAAVAEITTSVPDPMSATDQLGFQPRNIYTEFDADGLPINSAYDPRVNNAAPGDLAAFLDFEATHTAESGFLDLRAPWEFFTDPVDMGNGTLVAARMGLFSPDALNGRWRSPWISVELGARLTLLQRVYLRARMYRALDVRGFQLTPSTAITLDPSHPDPSKPHGVAEVETAMPARYLYNSKTQGRVRGSIFPPLAIDRAPTNITLVASEVAGPAPPAIKLLAGARPDPAPPTSVLITGAVPQPVTPDDNPPLLAELATVPQPQPVAAADVAPAYSPVSRYSTFG
jgi:hypothetical protein